MDFFDFATARDFSTLQHWASSEIFRLCHSHFQAKELPVVNFLPMDAAMDVEDRIVDEIDLSDGAMAWLRANRAKLEDMVQKRQTMWSLEEWETFQEWAYTKTEELHQAQKTVGEMKRSHEEWQRGWLALQTERQEWQAKRRELEVRIACLEKGHENFSNMPKDYLTGFMAIERLVCDTTRELGPPESQIGQLPPGGEVLIIDRLDQLVGRMAQMEQIRMGERR